jgi:hypothetical protein
MIPNTNIAQVFQYSPPSPQESLLLATVKEYRDSSSTLSSELVRELMNFYELIKNENSCDKSNQEVKKLMRQGSEFRHYRFFNEHTMNRNVTGELVTNRLN